MFELVNLGSLCIDNVYRVPAIARGGETLSALGPARFAGGKGLNQSLAAAQAGCRVAHCGCVGADGAFLIQVLRDAGVDVSGIRMQNDVPSGHAVIQVDPTGANAIVIVGGANRVIDAGDVERALAILEPDGWLLLQNEINDIEHVLSTARKAGVRVAMNVAPVDGRETGYDLAALDLLVVNEWEAQALSGEPEGRRAVDALTARCPELQIVVTRGERGLTYGRGRDRIDLGAFAVAAVDETAAGDAFIGYLMHGMLRRSPAREALVRASAAGAIAVTRAGAADSIPSGSAVAAFLAERAGEAL